MARKAISRFFYSIFHAGALLRENEALTQKVADANRQIDAMQLQQQELAQELICTEMSIDEVKDEVERFTKLSDAYRTVLIDLLPEQPDATQVDALFHAVAPYLDPEGWVLFREAEKLLGQLQYSDFVYEENRGIFEEANGYQMLPYLEVSSAWRFGEANDRPRWDFVEGASYELCTDFSINKTTLEYREYQLQLRKNFLITTGALPQREAAPEQAQTNEAAAQQDVDYEMEM